MREMKKLPMGIEDFEEMRTMGYYYVDKTGLIRTLLENPGKVNLFTRPRRFGKTLNMSMLKYFFETGSENSLFDGLEISRETDLCSRYMGRFPVISISLKNAEGDTFEKAKKKFKSVIGNEAVRFSFLSESGALNETERQQYTKLIQLDDQGEYAMSDELLENSLLMLSRFLYKHYGQKTIILIDEYDVPLDKAYQSGFYDSMVDFIRTILSQALKTNVSLHFAVLTGCLRISKESIFTGFNNFNVYSVKDVQYNEYFGFSDMEVRKMLEYYGFMEKYDVIREWYDGYRFGELNIFCPWDVVSYCHALKLNSSAVPQNYWVNTSSNSIVRKFLHRADGTTRDEIELLISGGIVWTGLVIPNKEVRWIFEEQIQDWFEEETKRDAQMLKNFCRAFEENDTAAIEKGFTSYLRKTISIRDNNVKKEMKENFYHGILLGLFAGMEGWKVKSNPEAGEGYCDISVEVENKEIGIIIEVKYAENASFDHGCKEALRQIADKNYAEMLLDDGMTTIRTYGIACYKKRCRVVSG